METSDKSSMGEYKPKKDREMSLNVENRMAMGQSNNRTAGLGTTTEMEDRHLMNKRRVLPEDAPSLPNRMDIESTTEFDMEDRDEDEDEEDIEELK